jgi:transglutaminase-like putative cysteine protease
VTRARLRRLRLLLRDASAALAFGTMALSGELPGWGVALVLSTCAVALLGYRPLSRLGTASAVLLAVAGVLLYLPVATGRLDLVVAATTFAGLLAAQRLLVEPAPRVDGQVHLVGLLMAAGGAALSGDLLYPLVLAAFCACSCGSLALGVLESSAGAGDTVPVGPSLQRVGAGLAVGLMAAALFFVLFPRLSWSVAARRVGRGVGATTGLGTNIRLGATGGNIKTSARAVARMKLTPDPGKPELGRYFPATVLSRFDGQGWEGVGTAQAPAGRVTRGEVQDTVLQEISLLPGYGAQVALGMHHPVRFLAATALRSGGNSAQVNLVDIPGKEVRFASSANAYTYLALSAQRPAPASEREVQEALQLPERLDPRIGALALELLGSERAPRAAAARLESWLKGNLRYTLELPEAPVTDPLSHFLFERKAGHCEYFASALAVMLRSVGIPARVMVGFYGGTRNGAWYLLRAGDAHAWTEVHVPGEGFVPFDATPEAGRMAQGAAWIRAVMDGWEQLEAWWSSSVLDYSLKDQFDFVRKMLEPPQARTASRGERRLPVESERAAVAVAAGVLAFWLVRRWARAPVKAKPHPAEALRQALDRAAVRAGVEVHAEEDVSAAGARLAAAAHPLASAYAEVSARYLVARFGDTPLRDGEIRACVRLLDRGLRRAAHG